MKHLFLTLLLATLCPASAFAQTINTLGFNSTNGQVVANTTNVLTFTNAVAVTSIAAQDDGEPSINFNNSEIVGGWDFTGAGFGFGSDASRDGSRLNLGFSTNLNSFWLATNAATARTSLGLGLSALTNTSNATAMRALAGSTNTNEPYSGTVALTNTNVLVFSNGILQSVQ
jgi:hypothetical protein